MRVLRPVPSRFCLSGKVMTQEFVCDKCQESPDGPPTAVVTFKGKDGEDQPFDGCSSPLTLCQSCAPKLYRIVNSFVKR